MNEFKIYKRYKIRYFVEGRTCIKYMCGTCPQEVMHDLEQIYYTRFTPIKIASIECID